MSQLNFENELLENANISCDKNYSKQIEKLEFYKNFYMKNFESVENLKHFENFKTDNYNSENFTKGRLLLSKDLFLSNKNQIIEFKKKILKMAKELFLNNKLSEVIFNEKKNYHNKKGNFKINYNFSIKRSNSSI